MSNLFLSFSKSRQSTILITHVDKKIRATEISAALVLLVVFSNLSTLTFTP